MVVGVTARLDVNNIAYKMSMCGLFTIQHVSSFGVLRLTCPIGLRPSEVRCGSDAPAPTLPGSGKSGWGSMLS